MQYINNILDHPQREYIETKLKVIEFCDKYGFEAVHCVSFFNLDKIRSTNFLSRKRVNWTNQSNYKDFS